MKKMVFLSAAAILSIAAFSQTKQADIILKGFNTPPDAAKPRVWWHWQHHQRRHPQRP